MSKHHRLKPDENTFLIHSEEQNELSPMCLIFNMILNRALKNHSRFTGFDEAKTDSGFLKL